MSAVLEQTPDTAGFIEAANAMRSQLGAQITFKIPVAKAWPGGTKINPDTGLPYDATIQQTSAEFTTIVKTCLVIEKQGSPLRPQSDTVITAAGELSGMDIIVDIAQADYLAVEGAVEMTVDGLEYKIREAKPFQIAGVIYRQLMYGEQL